MITSVEKYQDLIDKELSEPVNGHVIKFEKFKPTNRVISWLFRHYRVTEQTDHFYDSEPYNQDEDMDYNSYEWRELCRAYENRRMRFCNWIDAIGDGLWGMSRKRVDRISKRLLKGSRSRPAKNDGRYYIGFDGDYAYVYWFGRDKFCVDYWWVFKKRT